jgi:hypothetical protein
MVNMVLQDAQPKVVIVSPSFFPNVQDAGVPVLQLVPGWEDSLLPSAEEAAAAFTDPVMVREDTEERTQKRGHTEREREPCLCVCV